MVQKISYRGWNNAWQLSNGAVELVVLADVGPRIVRYGFCGGENILCELSQEAGLTGGNDFHLYGGHRLWAWPEVARTYFPDNRPVSVSQAGEAVRFTERAGAGLDGFFQQLGLVPRSDFEELELRVAQLEHRLRLVEDEPPQSAS